MERFEKINAQLEGVYDEITSLSKKSPNDGVNKFKLRLVNKILEDANLLLDDKHKPFDEFTVFDEETLPSNSDVAFILAQYLSWVESLRGLRILKNQSSAVSGTRSLMAKSHLIKQRRPRN